MSVVDSSSLLATATTVSWVLDGFTDEPQPRRQQIVLNTFPFQIGRKSGLPLTLNSPAVSKIHAEISRQGDELWLHDLHSTNGTYLNGQRVEGRLPLKTDDVLQFADIEFRLLCRSIEGPHNSVLPTFHLQYSTLLQFRQLLEVGDLIPHFQPVVKLSNGSVLGYEALARSNYEGLQTAHELFQTAMRLGKEAELSELCRRESLRHGLALPRATTLFVNTHPAEIGRPTLIESLRQICQPQSAMPIVLEIHERAACDMTAMQELRAVLRELNIGLAYDDFGNGQSRLVELMEIPPDFVKFDMALIRDIHKATPHKQKTLETLVKMVRNLGVAPLAEGIECLEEAAVCNEMGFLYAQGFLFGKPEPAADVLSTHIEQNFGIPVDCQPGRDGFKAPWLEQDFQLSMATPWRIRVN